MIKQMILKKDRWQNCFETFEMIPEQNGCSLPNFT